MFQKLRKLQKDNFWMIISFSLGIISFCVFTYFGAQINPWLFFCEFFPLGFFAVWGICLFQVNQDEQELAKEEEKLRQEREEFEETIFELERHTNNMLKFWGGRTFFGNKGTRDWEDLDND